MLDLMGNLVCTHGSLSLSPFILSQMVVISVEKPFHLLHWLKGNLAIFFKVQILDTHFFRGWGIVLYNT